jgi:quercetin dioxygenase-like cupin family protein
MSNFDEWLEKVHDMKDYDPEREMPDSLVTSPDTARWLDPEITGNPSRIGVLVDVPARSMEFYLQEIPAHSATDLQRHVHESVHYVTEGSGYSEIGKQTLRWNAGDLVYTPSWVWHRHYNDGSTPVRMLLVENSKALDSLGINQRESAGNITYKENEQA